MKISNKTQTFKCKHCPVILFSGWDRNEHQKEHFDENKKLHYNCMVNDCLQKFESPNEFAVHWNDHYSKRPYKCQYCPRRFGEAGFCANHEVSHLDKSVVKAIGADGFTYKERRELDMWGFLDQLAPGPERNSRREFAFLCAKCGSKVFGSISFRKHLEIHDDELNTTYKCKYCSVELFSKSERATHHANHIYEDGNIHFNCTETNCLQKFESATDYAAHFLEHYAKLHGCNFCPRRFKDVAICVNHEANQHLQLDIKGTKDNLGADGLTYSERRECEILDCLKYLAPGPERNKRNCLAFICPTCSNKMFTASYFKIHINHHKGGKLQCEFCAFSCDQESRFKEHMVYHTVEKSVPCDLCEQKLRTQNHLNKHIKKYHSNKMHCKCKHCEQEFEDEYCRKKHVVAEHGGSKKCHFCDMGFTKQLVREQHEQREHAECEKCGERFGKVVSLLRHSILHESITQHCLDCQREFSDRYSLLQHAKSEHQDYKAFECELCGKRFRTNEEVRMHHRQRHEGSSRIHKSTKLTEQEEKELEALGYMEYLAPGPERDFANKIALICPKCNMKSFGYTRFKIHLNKHELIHCEFCMHSTVSPFRMKQHVEQMHSDERAHACGICGQTFKLKNNMLKHQEVHKRKKFCKCIFCGEEFQDKYTLVLHKNKFHGGVVKCHFCDEGFSVDTIRDQHEQKNHPEKLPAKCELCSGRFRNKMALFSHMAYHKRKLQNCLECHEQFECEYDLLQHVKIHANYLGYECEFCGKRFPAKVNLRSHRKIVHKVKPSRILKRRKQDDNKENKSKHSESENDSGEGSSASEVSDAYDSDTVDFAEDNFSNSPPGFTETMSLIENSKLPMACAIKQQMMTNLNGTVVAWTMRLEPDLVTLANLHPGRILICMLENDDCQYSMKKMGKIASINKISITLSLPKTKSFCVNIFSFVNLQLKNFYNSFKEFENSIKEVTKQNKIGHYVRNTNRELQDTLEGIIKGRLVTCNY